jgi:hypothetical protein
VTAVELAAAAVQLANVAVEVAEAAVAEEQEAAAREEEEAEEEERALVAVQQKAEEERDETQEEAQQPEQVPVLASEADAAAGPLPAAEASSKVQEAVAAAPAEPAEWAPNGAAVRPGMSLEAAAQVRVCVCVSAAMGHTNWLDSSGVGTVKWTLTCQLHTLCSLIFGNSVSVLEALCALRAGRRGLDCCLAWRR